MTEPMPGDFFVTTTSGSRLDRFFAWCIRWGTESSVNHAGIYIGNGQIVEAVRGVVRGVESEYPDAIWSTGFGMLDAERAKVIDAANSYVGRKYNYLDILAIGLAQKRFGSSAARVSKWWWVKRVTNSKAMICSELVTDAYRAAGINLFPGVPAGLVSPGDLLRRIEE